MRPSKRVVAVAAVLALAAAGGVARAAVNGGGAAGDVEFQTGGGVSTPSGSFITVATRSFTSGPGPIVVSFSAEGWDQDWTSGGSFAGHNYAALRVRVLLNNTPVAPGAVVFFDNTGKITIRTPRPTSTSFDWAATMSSGGVKTVKVQVANLHTFDMAQINHYTLSIQHG